jgi:hypothetical protein
VLSWVGLVSGSAPAPTPSLAAHEHRPERIDTGFDLLCVEIECDQSTAPQVVVFPAMNDRSPGVQSLAATSSAKSRIDRSTRSCGRHPKAKLAPK